MKSIFVALFLCFIKGIIAKKDKYYDLKDLESLQKDSVLKISMRYGDKLSRDDFDQYPNLMIVDLENIEKIPAN